ncbi:DUF1107 family protein [Alginatibacterium sediminis]|uniref:DUF1107 family protein n=1 Tax=Alginatibacterium sediminis TaxID=2164068 RepID=A0A420EGQ5_9ALTE|nr:DUF1107 family protein [Alginatibacterium sediminis]RKF19736.1 DUF1107 family protein [Alginatibacterium sediminis]
MKRFLRYSPQRIARYVKTFFKGRLHIQGRGAYEFKDGRLYTLPNHSTNAHRKTVDEVNQQIEVLQSSRKAA